ncbi:tetratricopeptide repeat protein [Paraflavitalea pollutisoli]|uniref:tetratricopeptide repeat protein n=1 Tax=Paraflavitalea pollutisoli TaxID=3034143 RepID=UPI0023ED02C6|nr:tetratricopeptide repeat protein [Paraflavitalea sp. H1-2-19X]
MKISTLLTAGSILLCQSFASAQSTAIDKNKVQDYFQEQQFDEAIQYLQPLVEADSTNQAALRYLGYAYYMNDNVRDAKTVYLKMFSNDSLNVTANHYLATIFYNREPDLAMEYYARLIRLQPRVANYHRGLGELFSRKKGKDTALVYLHNAYALAPGDFRNLVALAEVLIDVKDYAQADSLLEVGLTRDSNNMSVLRSRVRSAYENKDYNAVLKPGEALIRLSELNLGPINKLILSYYNLQRYEESVRVCEYVMRAGIEVEAVYYYAAKSFAKLKQYDRSNELLDACLEKAISKTGEMYYFAYGENFEATKQFKKAVAAYDTAYYLYKSPLALYNCGRICEVSLKNEALARKYYTQYLKTAIPLDADERKAYAYVKQRWGKKK